MLRIAEVWLEVLVKLRVAIEQIERHDGEMARQMRRSGASVALNIAEGSGVRGKNRGLRYSTALGEARETLTGLRVALAWGYVTSIDPAVLSGIDHTIGTLVKVIRRG